MSVVLNINKETRQQDSVLQAVQNPAERFKNHVSKLSRIETELLESLPDLDEDNIVIIRLNSRKLGAHSWIIECACDAQFWNRAEAKRGRGNVDRAGVGIMAAVAKRAKQVGCTPKTIRLNARIYNLLKENVNNSVHILLDKAFYIAAVSAGNPTEALESFVTQKEANPKFNAARAARQVAKTKQDTDEAKQKIIDTTRPTGKKALQSNIISFLVQAKKFRASCPDKEFVETMYDEVIREWEEYLEDMDTQDFTQAICKSWDSGHFTETQIAEDLKIPQPEIHKILVKLQREGLFYPDKNKSASQLWHKSEEG